MLKLKKVNIILLLILLLAFAVRMWGINFGLPHKHILDEEAIIYGAFYTGTNQLQPLRYIYAPLVPYLILAEYGFYFIFGKLFGSFVNTNDFFISYLEDPTTFFLIARITLALFGVATVWLTWFIGKKFFDSKIGLIAAFFLALVFLHVKESHYIKEDIIAGFFVLVTFYFSLKILVAGRLKSYLWAGVAFGLALGAKYQSALILPVVIISHFLRTKKLELKKLLLFSSSAFLAYVVTNPYIIIESRTSIQGLIAESALGRVFYPLHLQGKSVPWWFATEHVPQGLGWPLFLFGVFGFIVCIWIWRKDKRKKQYLLIPVFPIIFFISLDFWTKFHFARYAVSVLPFFALGAAILVVFLGHIIKEPKVRSVFLILGSVLLILPSFIRTIKFNKLITSSDTREVSLNWVLQNVEESSKILVESTVRPEYPSNLATPLPLSKDAIEKRIIEAEKRGQEALFLKSLKTAKEGNLGYDIVATPRVDYKLDILEGSGKIVNDTAYLKEKGINYLVLSSWAIKPDISEEFLKSLAEKYEKVADFKPTYEFPDDPHFIRVDFAVLDSVDPFQEGLIFGPNIEIYQIK